MRRRQCGKVFAMKCMRKKVVLEQENIKGTKAERSDPHTFAPCALNPKPGTLHLQPGTLNPEP